MCVVVCVCVCVCARARGKRKGGMWERMFAPLLEGSEGVRSCESMWDSILNCV